MKNRSFLQSIYIVGVLGCLTLFGVFIFAGKQKTFSEQENRYLATFPIVSWKGILEGSVQKQLDNYANDQFPLRKEWMELSTDMEKKIGNSCINGVYLGKDGYYLEQVLDSQISKARYKNNLKMVQHFFSDGMKRKAMLLVPSRGCLLKDKLPKGAVMYNDTDLYQKGKNHINTGWLDIRKELWRAAKTKQVYFKTDHHWTLQGAYIAYTALQKEWGNKTVPYETFLPTRVSKHFLGTMYAKVLERHPQEDGLDIPKALPQPLKVTCDGEVRQGIYVEEKLQGNDKYAVYFGGNYGIVEIENPKATAGTLLVIKDSFANSLVPMLIGQYKKIIMLDLRYYNLSVKKIVQENPKADVLVLYEMSNFAKEEHLYKLLN